MTSRQQRRAAERKARKQAIRNESAPLATSNASPAPSPEAKTEAVQPSSKYEAFIAAAGSAILFPGEECDAYRAHLRHFFHRHQPETGMESEIVKRLADFQWRLKRIATLEAGIMSLGRRKYADLFAETAPDLRYLLIDAHTLVAEGQTFKRLHAQETQLRRFYANDLRELNSLQQVRLHPADERPGRKTGDNPDPRSVLAASATAPPVYTDPVLLPDDDGFEFSFPSDNALSTYAMTDDLFQSMLDAGLVPDSFETEPR